MCDATNKNVTVVLGAQWGDEGKGKIVDTLAAGVDIVCRCEGGNNTGHTVFVKNIEYNFHLVPTGIIHSNCQSLIGNGVVVHLPGLFNELKEIEDKGLVNWRERLVISDRAHLVFDFHQMIDGLQEVEKGGKLIGTTRKGIGPAYSSKAARTGIRVADLIGSYKVFCNKFSSLVQMYKKIFPGLNVDIACELERYRSFAENIRPLVVDGVTYIHKALNADKKVLVEGANGSMLDIDLGTYPYVTSSNCTIGAVCTGLGIPPSVIGDVIGVFKAYSTRVGSGPFPTELKCKIGDMLQVRGGEICITTKRNRRCGWIDIPLLKFTAMVNGYTKLCMTKLDVLDIFDKIYVCTKYRIGESPIDYYPSTAEELASVKVEYECLSGWLSSTEHIRGFSDLPARAIRYILRVQEEVGVPVSWVGVGKKRDAVINVV